MKPHFCLFVFTVIVLSAILCSMKSYRQAECDIRADMTQALQQTLARQQEQWLTPDTIRDFRSHLRIAQLRRCSFVGYDMKYSGICSKSVAWSRNGSKVSYRSYADCSPLTVLAISNQRLSAVFWVLALAWGVLSLWYARRRQELHTQLLRVGMIGYDVTKQQFVDAHQQPIRLTPMQQQLMELFFQAEDNRLSKQEICDHLWPKKPDASETLYTLIRRLKPVVEQNSNLQIVSDRGKAYQLKVR